MKATIQDAKHSESLERIHILLGASTVARIREEAASNYREVSAHVRSIIDGHYERQDANGKTA